MLQIVLFLLISPLSVFFYDADTITPIENDQTVLMSQFNENSLYDYPTHDLFKMAKELFYLNDYSNALLGFNEVIERTHVLQQPDPAKLTYNESREMFADASTYVGNINLRMGLYPNAIKHLLEAFKVYEEQENLIGVGNTLYNLGGAYFQLSDFEQSLNYYNQAMEYYLENPIPGRKTNLLNNIAAVYLRQNDFEKGLDILKRSLEAAKEENIKNVFIQYFNIGVNFRKIGELDSAEVYSIKAMEISRFYENDEDLSSAYKHMASVQYHKENYGEAFQWANKALEIAEKENFLHIKMIALRLLSDISSRQNKMADALEYYKQHVQVKDSLFNIQKHTQIRELQFQHETQQKEKEIQLLQVEKDYKNHQIKFQKRWITFLSIGSVFLGLLLLLVYYQKKNQKRANIDLVRKNLEIVEKEKLIKNNNQQSNNLRMQTPAYSLRDPTSETKEDNTQKPKKEFQISTKGEVIDFTDLSIKYNSSNLSDIHKRELLNRIFIEFEKNKVYQNEDFSLDKLAEIVGSNRTYVSQVINEGFGVNFSSFVNDFRIREARTYLADVKYRHYSIEAIAREVGFKSKSAFNSCFKKYTGITPSYFQENVFIVE